MKRRSAVKEGTRRRVQYESAAVCARVTAWRRARRAPIGWKLSAAAPSWPWLACVTERKHKKKGLLVSTAPTHECAQRAEAQHAHATTQCKLALLIGGTTAEQQGDLVQTLALVLSPLRRSLDRQSVRNVEATVVPLIIVVELLQAAHNGARHALLARWREDVVLVLTDSRRHGCLCTAEQLSTVISNASELHSMDSPAPSRQTWVEQASRPP